MSQQSVYHPAPIAQPPTAQSKYPTRAESLAETIRRMTAYCDDLRVVVLAADSPDDPHPVIVLTWLSRMLADWRGELTELEAGQ